MPTSRRHACWYRLLTSGLALWTCLLWNGVSPQPLSPAAESPTVAQSAEQREGRRRNQFPEFAVARLGTLRFREDGDVVWATFSPDGETIASCTSQGTVHLWDVRRGVARCTLHEGDPQVQHVVFSPFAVGVTC